MFRFTLLQLLGFVALCGLFFGLAHYFGPCGAALAACFLAPYLVLPIMLRSN